ncbi:MAG: hypothetical protein WEA54_05590 [Actinomycetota bacterium]
MTATTPPTASPSPGGDRARAASIGARLAVFAGVLFAGLGSWAILDLQTRLGGVLVGASGLGLIGAGILARRSATRLDLVLDSLADRTFDATVLASIAWATRGAEPATSLGALVAMAAGFLGAYVRAKGTSLGYGVVESPRTRGLRYGLITAGLLVDGWVRWTVWAAAGVSILATLVRSSQVAKEERA